MTDAVQKVTLLRSGAGEVGMMHRSSGMLGVMVAAIAAIFVFQAAGKPLKAQPSGQDISSARSEDKSRRPKRRNALPPSGNAAVSAPARTSTGFVPLVDMTADQRYKDQDGGLYGQGFNQPPAEHLQAALQEAAKIEPLDADGQPSPQGKIVFLTHGMSNTTLESQTFIELAQADQRKAPAVVFVDGAQGGVDAREWAAGERAKEGVGPWDRLERRLQAAGVTPRQVQVVWMKHAIAMKNPGRARQYGTFPAYARQLRDDMAQILGSLRQRFPNLRLAYVSSRSYGGYSTTPLNPEPYAYESAFAVRWLIQDQIKGDSALNYMDEKVPLILWGPYLWADGENGRKVDQLVFRRDDYRDDGTHPTDSGQKKIAKLLLEFFGSDATAKRWFVRGTPDP
ncbi:MAG TPA: hypothetical protein VM165_04005 [Planctomycetaceae bacterium]|nr:hypothetical protein [Planctomycetaceae bacterium]